MGHRHRIVNPADWFFRSPALLWCFSQTTSGYIFDVSQSYNIAFVSGGMLLIIGMLNVYFFGSHKKT